MEVNIVPAQEVIVQNLNKVKHAHVFTSDTVSTSHVLTVTITRKLFLSLLSLSPLFCALVFAIRLCNYAEERTAPGGCLALPIGLLIGYISILITLNYSCII